MPSLLIRIVYPGGTFSFATQHLQEFQRTSPCILAISIVWLHPARVMQRKINEVYKITTLFLPVMIYPPLFLLTNKSLGEKIASKSFHLPPSFAYVPVRLLQNQLDFTRDENYNDNFKTFTNSTTMAEIRCKDLGA